MKKEDRLDTQNLVVASGIGDFESNYQLLADLGMHAPTFDLLRERKRLRSSIF